MLGFPAPNIHAFTTPPRTQPTVFVTLFKHYSPGKEAAAVGPCYRLGNYHEGGVAAHSRPCSSKLVFCVLWLLMGFDLTFKKPSKLQELPVKLENLTELWAQQSRCPRPKHSSSTQKEASEEASNGK